jgi:hypothetical protein
MNDADGDVWENGPTLLGSFHVTLYFILHVEFSSSICVCTGIYMCNTKSLSVSSVHMIDIGRENISLHSFSVSLIGILYHYTCNAQSEYSSKSR